MTGAVTTAHVENAVTHLLGVRLVAFTEFIKWMLFVIQVTVIAAHVDHRDGFEHWKPEMATPAGILAGFVFLESCLSLAALLLNEVSVAQVKGATGNNYIDNATIKDLGPGFLTKYLTYLREKMMEMRKRPMGTTLWVAAGVSSVGQIAAGIMYICYSAGKFPHAEFSYLALILCAIAGKIIELLAEVTDFFLGMCLKTKTV